MNEPEIIQLSSDREIFLLSELAMFQNQLRKSDKYFSWLLLVALAGWLLAIGGWLKVWLG